MHWCLSLSLLVDCLNAFQLTSRCVSLQKICRSDRKRHTSEKTQKRNLKNSDGKWLGFGFFFPPFSLIVSKTIYRSKCFTIESTNLYHFIVADQSHTLYYIKLFSFSSSFLFSFIVFFFFHTLFHFHIIVFSLCIVIGWLKLSETYVCCCFFFFLFDYNFI